MEEKQPYTWKQSPMAKAAINGDISAFDCGEAWAAGANFGYAAAMAIAKKKPSSKNLTVSALVAEGLSQEDAEELIALRKRKRADLTPRSWQMSKEHIEKSGMSLQDGVAHWIKTGYQTFYPPNDRKGIDRGSTASQSPSAHNDFSKRDYRAGINADGTF